jgi:hypothetical protein
LKIFRLAVRAVVLLTTGPALLAFTACTVSSVAVLLTISDHATPGPAPAGLAPSSPSAPAIATAPALRPAPAGGSAAAIASVPVDPPSPSRSPVRAPAKASRSPVRAPAKASRSPVRAPAKARRRHGGNGRPPIAPADDLGNGTVYYAWITGVRTGRPGRVTLEMAWHYTGEAAERYAAEHRLPLPLDDHIDVDRRFAVTVTVAPRARTLINADGQGPRQLPASAFLARAARNLAIKINGQLAGPLYEVGFDNGALVLAYQIFQP